jgi:hypothetical protein
MWALLSVASSANAMQTFTVNSSLDEPDADVSDGICRSPSGECAGDIGRYPW